MQCKRTKRTPACSVARVKNNRACVAVTEAVAALVCAVSECDGKHDMASHDKFPNAAATYPVLKLATIWKAVRTHRTSVQRIATLQ